MGGANTYICPPPTSYASDLPVQHAQTHTIPKTIKKTQISSLNQSFLKHILLTILNVLLCWQKKSDTQKSSVKHKRLSKSAAINNLFTCLQKEKQNKTKITNKSSPSACRSQCFYHHDFDKWIQTLAQEEKTPHRSFVGLASTHQLLSLFRWNEWFHGEIRCQQGYYVIH